jgi:hypothetical protein
VTQLTPLQPDSQEVAKRLTTIIDYVRDCERRVNQGELMELENLDRNVLEVCNSVGALPQEEGKKLEKQMSSLIKDLESLANAMRAMAAKMDAEERKKGGS